MPVLKLALGDDIRRIPLAEAPSYEQLVQMARELFRDLGDDDALAPAAPARAPLLFRYTDDEGDSVTVSSSLELREAFASQPKLKLYVQALDPSGEALDEDEEVLVAARPPATATAVAAVAEAAAPQLAPSSAPTAVLTAAVARAMSIADYFAPPPAASASVSADASAAVLPAAPPQPSMQFVADELLADGENVPASSFVYKGWAVRNNGEATWPAGTHVVLLSGDDRGWLSWDAEPFKLAEPGQQVSITVRMALPDEPLGDVKYTFALADAAGRTFIGDSLWTELRIIASPWQSESEQLVPAPSPSASASSACPATCALPAPEDGGDDTEEEDDEDEACAASSSSQPPCSAVEIEYGIDDLTDPEDNGEAEDNSSSAAATAAAATAAVAAAIADANAAASVANAVATSVAHSAAAAATAATAAVAAVLAPPRPEPSAASAAASAADSGAAQVVHEHVSCDVCGMHPIVGVRYKCQVCHDYDMCALCEATEAHDPAHPLTKFKLPNKCRPRFSRLLHHIHSHAAEVSSELQQAVSATGRAVHDLASKVLPPPRARGHGHGHGHGHSYGHQHGADHPGCHQGHSNAHRGFRGHHGLAAAAAAGPAAAPSTSARPQRNSQLHCRFVEDVTVPDGSRLEAGAEALKVWRLHNCGDRAWPGDASIVFVRGGGDLRVEVEQQQQGQVQPALPAAAAGDVVEVSLRIRAPPQPGHYYAAYSLADSAGALFGHKFWIDCEVVAAEGGAAGAGSAAFQPAAAAAVSAADTFTGEFAEQLRQLHQMGFTDVDANTLLLRCHRGDVQRAVTALLSGEVNGN